MSEREVSSPAQAVFRALGLDGRACLIFRELVEIYMQTGRPVGSQALAVRPEVGLSPATVRNVMAELEERGLLWSPHTSAGRLPSGAGLRLFVDGLLEPDFLGDSERASIEGLCSTPGAGIGDLLARASQALSSLSLCMSLVAASGAEMRLRRIELFRLGREKTLAVLFLENGMIESRVIDIDRETPDARLREAAAWLSSRLNGRLLQEMREFVLEEIAGKKAALDDLTAGLVARGVIECSRDSRMEMIVSGRSRLLAQIHDIDDLARLQALFDDLEGSSLHLKLLEAVQGAVGTRIIIGAESTHFPPAGCSLVIAPLCTGEDCVVGVLGVIGPDHLNYPRVASMVDFTAGVVSRRIGQAGLAAS